MTHISNSIKEVGTNNMLNNNNKCPNKTILLICLKWVAREPLLINSLLLLLNIKEGAKDFLKVDILDSDPVSIDVVVWNSFIIYFNTHSLCSTYRHIK
jgi:hypothetical protein